MITGGHLESRLDEVTRMLRGLARFASRAAFLMQRATAAGQSTDTCLDDAPVAAFAGAFLGCFTTVYFSAAGIPPDIASALAAALLCGVLLLTRTTGLFAGAFFPALYGGTFAGMTPILWLSDSASGHLAAAIGALSIALSLVCGLAFFAVVKLDTRSAAPIGVGCGGRLGAIATVASFLFIALVGPLGADTSRFHSVGAGAFDVEPWSAIFGFLACLVGISATLFVLRRRRIADGNAPERIFIASAVALLGLVVLILGDRDHARMLDDFYAGCFLGMSTPNRLKGWFQPVLGALVLIVVLAPVHAFLHDFGGSLGLAAFITAMLLVAWNRTAAWTTSGTTRNILTRSGSLGTAVASVVVAVFVPIGLTTADPPAEEVPGTLDATAQPTAGGSEATLVRLVIGNASPGTVDAPIPLGISLINAAADDVVILSGLPPGSNMTNGHPSATGSWRLFARELADAAIRPAQGFVGGTDATVELRHADQTIDRQALHLEWTAPALRAAMDADGTPPATGDADGTPPATGLATGQRPDAVTEDHAAIFPESPQFIPMPRRRPAGGSHPAWLGVRPAHPTLPVVGTIGARDQRVGGQGAAPTGPHRLVLTNDSGSARQVQPLARHDDRGDGQRMTLPKNFPLPSDLDRPIPVSASP
jgi:hypothetical protein